MQTAAQIIDTLGGSAAISRETGWALTTIESWKGSNFIPDWRRDRLVAFAGKLKVEVSAADFPCRRAATEERKVA